MNQNVLNAKKAIVSEITDVINASQCMVIVEYHGLTVSKLTNLRHDLHAMGAHMNVYKNSLVERALDGLKITGLEESLAGPNAVITSSKPLDILGVVCKYAKKNEEFKIKAGRIEGHILNESELNALSKIGSKEALISMLLSVLQAPVRNLAFALKQVADQKAN